MADIRPLVPRPEVMEFLLTRRSRPAKTLAAPAPDRVALRAMLEAAARAPDHGKLEPWRFLVLEAPACRRLGALLRRLAAARGEDEEQAAKAAAAFEGSPLCVAVVASPKPSEKIPEVEQTLSAGAVCLGLVNAALASGWGANWLTGRAATDREFLAEGLELAHPEWVAGFVHLGSETRTPPERPRPDMDAVVAWIES